MSCQQNQIAIEQAKPTINKNRKQNTVTTKGCVFFCKPYSKVDMWNAEPGRKLFIKERKVTVDKTQPKMKINKATHIYLSIYRYRRLEQKKWKSPHINSKMFWQERWQHRNENNRWSVNKTHYRFNIVEEM